MVHLLYLNNPMLHNVSLMIKEVLYCEVINVANIDCTLIMEFPLIYVNIDEQS